MGNSCSKCLSAHLVPSVSIAMIGLDGAGKSSLIHKWRTGQTATRPLRPTVDNLYYDLGFHMETIFYRDVSFTILELSGRPASRPTWRQYFSLKQAIIFVVDASDHVRIREAQVELHRMIASSEEEYSKLPIFIVGTKMDLPNSLDELTFMEMMKLHRIPATRNWHFQMVNLMTERNVYECLDWLMAQLKKDKVI
ncbi:Arf GTPase arf3 [Tyrophagus putrescentiae]|nr:Arf GTPase arf3 [Tyrophagus putrescentiae]